MIGVGSGLKRGRTMVGCAALRCDRPFTRHFTSGRVDAEVILSLIWARSPDAATDAEDATDAMTNRTGMNATRRINQLSIVGNFPRHTTPGCALSCPSTKVGVTANLSG